MHGGQNAYTTCCKRSPKESSSTYPNASGSLGKKAIVMTSGCCISQQTGVFASLFYMPVIQRFTAETGKCYDFPGRSHNARFNGEPLPPTAIVMTSGSDCNSWSARIMELG